MNTEKTSAQNHEMVDPKAPTRPLQPRPTDPAYKQTDRLSPPVNLIQTDADLDEVEDALPAAIQNNVLAKSIGSPFIQIAQSSNVGTVRQRNEDSCFTFVGQSGGSAPLLPFALALVADGMGGHADGHEASRKVADQVASYVLDNVYLPLLKGQGMQKPLQEILEEGVAAANRAIHTEDPDKEGGTTLTGALIVGRRLNLIHVGDTRAYLLSDETFEQLTTDHSIVKRLEESGQITAEQAAHHPHRNLLYRALTGHDFEVDTYTRSLPKSGFVFICSDGLWDTVEPNDLQLVILNPNLTLQERCETLVELALTNGSTDNVTGVLIEFRTA